MYQASTQFNEIILGSSRTFRTKMEVAGKSFEPGIQSIKLQGASNAGGYISIGGTTSAYITVSMRQQTGVLIENQEITLHLGIDTGSGNFEYVKMGLFTVQKPKNDDGLWTFTAYDRMVSKLSGAYFSNLTYPVDGKTALQEISTLTGVPISGLSSLPAGVMLNKRASISESGVDEDGNSITTTTYVNPFDGYTYREALGYIAQLYAKYAVINRDGAIELRWYQEVDYTVTASKYYDDLVTSEKNFSLGSIECTVGDKTLIAGTGTAGIKIENPVMTQERLNWIYTQLKDFSFLPASLSFFGDPRLDLGDIVKVNDKYGNIIKIPVMTLEQDFDGGIITSIGSVGKTEAESNSGPVKGPTAQALDRVYTELFLVKEVIGNKANFDYAKILDADIKTVRGDLADYKTVVTQEFTAQSGRIENVSGELASYKTIVAEQFTATSGRIDTVSGDLADYKTVVTEKFTAQTGEIEKVSGDLADYKTIVAGQFTAQTGQIEEITGNLADYKTVVAQELSVVTGRIGTLETESLKASEAELKYATIENLNTTNANVETLTGNLSSFETSMAQELIAAKGWMAEGSIGNAQIQSVDANKITSGTIDTGLVTVTGSDGRLQIVDNTMSISDANRVRVQVGKDASGDYTLAVWDAQGNLIWDALGATENTIQRKIIRDNVVADDAGIQGYKLDINSVVTSINGATTKIDGTVVQVGDKTLNIALSEQTQTITEQSELLATHEATIKANQDAIALRVTTSEYESYKTSSDSRFSTLDASIQAMQGQIALKVEQTDIDTAIQGAQSQIDQTVASVEVEYYLSASTLEPIGGTWSTTPPDWTEGYYMWSRQKTTLKNGTVKYSGEACISGATGQTGADGKDGEDVITTSVESSIGFTTKGNETATLTARIYKGSEEIDSSGDYAYTWYGLMDGASDYTVIGVGKNITLSTDEFNTTLQVYFECDESGTEVAIYYTDESGNVLTDESGNRLIA